MTLLEWLGNNCSNLKDGVYNASNPNGYIKRNGETIKTVHCVIPTTDCYRVENSLIALLTQPKFASDYLNEAANLLSERGKQYDKSGQERSMEKTVRIFNDMTGKNLTTVEGWYFMQVLKDVRFFQNTEKPHEDSLIDGISYRGLMTEEALKDV